MAKATDKPALLNAKKDSTTKDSTNVDALAKSNPLFAVLSPATYQGAWTAIFGNDGFTICD